MSVRIMHLPVALIAVGNLKGVTVPKVKIPLYTSQLKAFNLVEELRVFCQRIEVAGSIRRGAEMVGDIELVAIPLLTRGQEELFGDINSNMIWTGRRALDDLASDIIKDGPRYIQFIYEGTKVDLFLATPQNWGLILAIRTGPADFSRRLVTRQSHGGYKPDGYEVRDGAVWWGSQQHPIPEELDLFALWGMDWMNPEDRK